MSKKYSLKVYNNNKYAMIINSYSVYDGENTLITSGTNLSVNANSNVVLLDELNTLAKNWNEIRKF